VFHPLERIAMRMTNIATAIKTTSDSVIFFIVLFILHSSLQTLDIITYSMRKRDFRVSEIPIDEVFRKANRVSFKKSLLRNS